MKKSILYASLKFADTGFLNMFGVPDNINDVRQ
jgi:hypothetical protein